MDIFYNTTAQCRVDENNSRISVKPTLFYGAVPEWVLHFVEREPSETPQAVDLSAVISWRAAVDSDWKASTEPMCRTLNADIDKSGAENGIIKVPVDANTQTFLAAVQNKQSIPAYFELRGFDDQGNVVIVCLLNITAHNSIDPEGGQVPSPVPDDMASQAWVQAVIAQSLVYRYSADGANWHASLTSGDLYFEVKHGADGTWSDPQLIPYGPQGATGQTGATGATGATGPQGPEGPEGPAGQDGQDGQDGQSFSPDARGTLAGRDAYDEEAEGFCYLDIENGDFYFKLSATSGDWSDAVPITGPTGAQGPQGVQGPAGAAGEDGAQGPAGYLTIVVSQTQPTTPVEGMIWVLE